MNNAHKIIYYAHSNLGQQGIIIIQCLLDYYAFIFTYKNMCTVYDVHCTSYIHRYACNIYIYKYYSVIIIDLLIYNL